MSINSKNAIITFDYEVFLGRNTGTIQNSVLIPTDAINKILQKHNAKAIFFVDAAWLLCIKKYCPNDFKSVATQLKEITSQGSSVELHLHPQWLYAEMHGNQFVINSDKYYRIQKFSINEIHNIFEMGVEILEGITNQKPTCFRAGGWCIEPFDKLITAFKAHGIKYDFSVIQGGFLNEGKIYDYDFTKVPELPFYRFSNSVNEPLEDGLFVEFPLSTYRNNPFYRLANKMILKLLNDKIYGDGTGAKEKSLTSVVFDTMRLSKAMLKFDMTSHLLFRYLLNTHLRNSSLIIAVSHPKTVSKQSLLNLSFVAQNFTTLNSLDLQQLIKLHNQGL